MTQYVLNNIDPSVEATYNLIDDLGLIDENDTVSTVGYNFVTKLLSRWKNSQKLTKKYSKVEKEDDLLITLNGSGSYHHHTYGFCRGIVEQENEEYTVYHYDQHGDSRDNAKKIDCGSYLGSLIKDSDLAKKSIIIGALTMVHSPGWFDPDSFKNGVEIYPFFNDTAIFYTKDVGDNVDFVSRTIKEDKSYIKWHNIDEEGMETITRRALGRTETDSVYITVDLDVLRKEYSYTDWNNGDLDLNDLLDSIHMIKDEKKVLGLDICGTNGSSDDLHTLYTIAAIINEINDGPYSRDFFLEKIAEKFEESEMLANRSIFQKITDSLIDFFE